MAAMLRWFSDASTSASRWKRARRSGSAANDRGSTLIATCALQLGVGRAIDLAHAARADAGGDLVRANLRPRSQRHRRGNYMVVLDLHEPRYKIRDWFDT